MAKKLRAMQSAPVRKRGEERTARVGPTYPRRPGWVRGRSRSPRRRMAAAIRNSPVMARDATAKIALQEWRTEVGIAGVAGVICGPLPSYWVKGWDCWR